MEKNNRPKLLFLDGIRGISALYVVLYHSQLFTGYGFHIDDLSIGLRPLSLFLSFGHYSIAIFIVLSGFCLTIPVVISDDIKLRGGFWEYIKRRALRILPPYYFALLIFIGMITLIPILQTPIGTAWDSKIPLDSHSIISHLLVVHNLSEEWIYKIDGPMWSVATEWQIYFLFPLLLIIWRKFGILFSIATALLLSFLPLLLLPKTLNFSWIHPWYLSLFGFGMVSANIVYSKKVIYQLIRDKIIWNLLPYVCLVFLIIYLIISHQFINFPLVISELIVGGIFSIALIHYSVLEINGEEKSRVLNFLNKKIILSLGSFSYSIYLIHSPFLGLFNLLTLNIPFTIDQRLSMMLLVSVPLSLSISYLFYYFVERKAIQIAQKLTKYSLKNAIA